MTPLTQASEPVLAVSKGTFKVRWNRSFPWLLHTRVARFSNQYKQCIELRSPSLHDDCFNCGYEWTIFREHRKVTKWRSEGVNKDWGDSGSCHSRPSPHHLSTLFRRGMNRRAVIGRVCRKDCEEPD